MEGSGPVGRAWTAMAALAVAAGAVGLAGAQAPPRAGEVRALWVRSSSLTTPASVAAVVRTARAVGFNTLLAQVRARGEAYYASRVEPRAEGLGTEPSAFDPLATLLAEARRAGLRVHAWVNLNFVSSAVTLPASPEHVVYRHPEWLMVPRPLVREILSVDPASPAYVGRLARWTRAELDRVEGLYLSPIDPAVHHYLSEVVSDLVGRYPLDGVHLDYIRYPDDRFDYSPPALAAFRAAVAPELDPSERRRLDRLAEADPLAYPDSLPEAWSRFRRARLSALLMRLRTAVRLARPAAVVSAAVAPDVDEAFARRLQDWRVWLENGLVDAVCPMAYTDDPSTFTRQVGHARALAGPRAVWAGIGAFRLPAPRVPAFIDFARAAGADGVAIFSYDSLTGADRTSALEEIGRAFLPGAGGGSR